MNFFKQPQSECGGEEWARKSGVLQPNPIPVKANGKTPNGLKQSLIRSIESNSSPNLISESFAIDLMGIGLDWKTQVESSQIELRQKQRALTGTHLFHFFSPLSRALGNLGMFPKLHTGSLERIQCDFKTYLFTLSVVYYWTTSQRVYVLEKGKILHKAISWKLCITLLPQIFNHSI